MSLWQFPFTESVETIFIVSAEPIVSGKVVGVLSAYNRLFRENIICQLKTVCLACGWTQLLFQAQLHTCCIFRLQQNPVGMQQTIGPDEKLIPGVFIFY